MPPRPNPLPASGARAIAFSLGRAISAFQVFRQARSKSVALAPFAGRGLG